MENKQGTSWSFLYSIVEVKISGLSSLHILYGHQVMILALLLLSFYKPKGLHTACLSKMKIPNLFIIRM